MLIMLTRDSRGVGVFVYILHMFHELLSCDAELLAERAATRVRASHKRSVLESDITLLVLQ